MTDMTSLIRKRGTVKHKITNFIKYFDPLYVKFVAEEQLETKYIIELQIRLNKLEQAFDEFESVQDQIEIDCPLDQLEMQSQERDIFANNYYGLVAKTKEILKKYEDNDSVVSANSRVSNINYSNPDSFNLQGIKLPPIKCPTFNCEFSKWLEFKDTFEALFHNNAGLSDIQKFHYLRSCLGDESLKIIQSLDFAAQNYNNAWELLCDRFDNSRLLVNNHLKSLFEIQNLSKESSSDLRKLIDTINKHLRALKTLQLPTENWDAILIYMFSLKLDKNTNREWEQTRTDKKLPTLTNFFSFLQNRADFLETLEMNNFSKKSDMCSEPKGKQRHYSLLLSDNEKRQDSRCNFCKQQHLIYACDKFLKLSISERWNHVKKLRLCSNCLCYGHFSSKCSSGCCKFCSNKHSSLLHYKKPRMEAANVQFNNQPGSSRQQHDSEDIDFGNSRQEIPFNGSSVVCANKMTNSNYVLLSTAVVYVQSKDGHFHKANALLDSGSQCSFISESFCSKVGSDLQSVKMCVSGINNSTSSTRSKCEIFIKSTISQFKRNIACFVVPKITDNLPSYSINISGWSIPSDIPLANPSFNVPQVVDLLLGADVFWEILLDGRISLGKNKPLLINTAFGYVVSGSIPNSIVTKQVTCNFLQNNELEKFWLVEELPHDSQCLTMEEDICEEYFHKTVTRDSFGKFVVRIPLKESPLELGDSKQIAIKRLLLQETKLKRNEKLKEKYVSFMNEYVELEHMKKLTNVNDCNMFRCFLPHFPVIRENSLTTNVRIVFDGSCKTTSGKSLNDIQYIGPAIQNDIFRIMLRFRQHKFVVIADIAKMYRQILIHPDDRYLQNVLWRNDFGDEISIFELQTVTYGTSSAPYLAIKCLKHLASINRDKFPTACEVIDRDMYVDDLITGFDNEVQGVAVCNQVSSILKSASFSLRKWASNSHVILKGLSDISDTFGILDFGENDSVKTLGIQWNSQSDLLSFKVSIASLNGNITKRQLLSNIAKLYDPLGLVSPCVIIAKILIQKLWLEKLGWDDCVPHELTKQWDVFALRLPILDDLRIIRFTVCNSPVSIELHGFSDASLNAYSAVVYVRSVDLSGEVYVRLLCSKTKVAPVKTLTIPRLELCGALTLARLMRNVSDSLTLPFESFYWCDSQIVLSWLNTDASKLQVFVSNRVTEIQKLSNISRWNYVNTKDNPADIASRGMYPDDLCKNHLWWSGPTFLHGKRDWPHHFQCASNGKLPELKNKYIVSICNSSCNSLQIFERFSSLNKLKRVFAYILRFIRNLKNKEQKETGQLTVIELENSLVNLSKLAQSDCYLDEITIIKCKKELNKKSRLLSLNPFIDSDGLLRVGGRLRHSSLSFDTKHPILLDGKHKLSKLIFLSEHIRLLHPGPQLLLFSVRQSFWVTSGMNVAKSVVRNCLKCFRFKPKPADTIMGDLPKHRVNISKPFSITGVDYAGPVNLRDRKGRPYKTYKAYICMFICFATKAIHIELVTDLTCEAFIASLRRFTSRRGTPSHLYSDNGTNFVASQKELIRLYNFLQNSEDELVALCSKEHITWHFIPPNSPNFGGLWESNIKAIKNHLYRVIGDSILTFEEYLTLLVQVEAVLNSRPLHPMSSDPNDFTPLTPSHLLIGKLLITPPDPLLNDVKTNRLSRYEMLQQINQSFWKRWSSSYVADLQRRVKWKATGTTVKLGTMVVLKNDNLPPCRWLLGRIVQVHPGLDGKVRVVTVKTQHGTFKRAISKVCPLPMPSEQCTF